MITVKVRDNEPFEKAFKRFTKACEKSGLMSEIKKHQHNPVILICIILQQHTESQSYSKEYAHNTDLKPPERIFLTFKELFN